MSGYWSAGKYMPTQYRKAVAWVALNDEPLEQEIKA